jgi:hypothetical protein
MMRLPLRSGSAQQTTAPTPSSSEKARLNRFRTFGSAHSFRPIGQTGHAPVSTSAISRSVQTARNGSMRSIRLHSALADGTTAPLDRAKVPKTTMEPSSLTRTETTSRPATASLDDLDKAKGRPCLRHSVAHCRYSSESVILISALVMCYTARIFRRDAACCGGWRRR